jgi:hypothetical protein
MDAIAGRYAMHSMVFVSANNTMVIAVQQTFGGTL